MAMYDALRQQKAEGIVRSPSMFTWLSFRGHDRFVILEPGPDKILSFL